MTTANAGPLMGYRVLELTTTVAPNPERRRAVCSPMPLDEPVTIATRPSNSDAAVWVISTTVVR